MSKLDELIQELCPNGVEYRKLEDCCTVLDKKRKPVTKAAREAGEYPYYGANGIQDYVSDYIFDGIFVLVGEDGSVITKAGTPVVTWAEGKIWVNNHAHIIEGTDDVLLRYLFHYIQTICVTPLIHGNIPKLTGRDFRALQIPVPPLEVQREIVRILDSFMLLTAELTAELTARKKQYEYYRDELLKPKTNIPMVRLDVQKRYAEVLDNFDAICSDLNIELPAEIEARQKQYEYYRDALLTYAAAGKTILTDKQTSEYNALIRLCQYVFGFVMLPLSEICNSISSGKAKTKDDIGKYPVYGSTGIIARTDNAVYNKMNILVARVGANAGYTHLAQGGYDVSDNTLIVDVKSEYSLKYIYYQLVNIGLNQYAKGGGQPLVTAGQIKEIVLPVPMKQEQDRIVEILDRFDNLCNDLNIGLPAEIEARQKQYEYYRDKLLSFKQL